LAIVDGWIVGGSLAIHSAPHTRHHLWWAILYDIFSSSDFKSLGVLFLSILKMSSIIFLPVESSLPSQRAISE
jgi:hypothetical protein